MTQCYLNYVRGPQGDGGRRAGGEGGGPHVWRVVWISGRAAWLEWSPQIIPRRAHSTDGTPWQPRRGAIDQIFITPPQRGRARRS